MKEGLVSFVHPPPLRPGDTVRVVAPAGPFDRESFEAGLAVLRRRYDVRFDEGLFSRDRYLAGTDARRQDELQAALDAPDARAVFAARGGYGAMRLLPKLSFARRPLPALCGFSDITALHLAMQAKGLVSLHAPVLTQLGRQPPEVVDRLFALLEAEDAPAAPLSAGRPLVSGTAEGPLIGGNLSVLTRLVGTPYLPDLRGALLLLEDVGERPYRLDRMWTHLALAGAFEGVRGIVLGDFTLCEEQAADYGPTDVLRSLAESVGLPCALGFRIGHGDVNLPVPLGVRARLDADAGTLSFQEPFAAKRAGA